MSPDDVLATRRELDQLSGWLQRLENQLDRVDRDGTRGMGAVQVQMSDLAARVGNLAGAQTAWQDAHERSHAQEAAERQRGRRWLLSLGVAGVTALCGLYPLIVALASRRLATMAAPPFIRTAERPGRGPGRGALSSSPRAF